ncbi:polymeric immunoglobulin receptor-like isoform X1 [Sinocyclocheilus anshuiensis]|uniref:polymeric immunoglobulin receptor-like isoform X1 n=1 Tax=Sinocyclocheilus anshuiensis TaxID=1608454 RepID=UPI0007B99408|nr:PREDICTED: polymeric immunoglobulin receptor-like isoform X1 [Sinocyclocheilus anshuiensis]
MDAYAKTKIFYISIGVWLILGVVSYSGWSKHVLTILTGGSVTIPCHYDKKCTQQKKYWFSEIDESNTYTNKTEENLSVIDHPDQSLFTVTMRNLQDKHNGHYYCVVETGEQSPINIIYETQLKIQSAPDVSVVSSNVSGHEGGDISVKCLYSSGYQNKLKQWCRYKDQSCYTVGRNDTSQNSSVQISDDDGGRSFTVLMTGLRLTDSGWYFCSAGEALSPVHLTVTEAEPDKEKDTSKSGHHENNNNNTTEVTGNPQNNKLLNVWLKVSAALLLLLILFIVFTWRLRRRPKEEQDEQQIRERNGSRTIDTCEIQIYSKPEYPVIYSTINDENPNDANKDITTYSTIDNVSGSEARPPAVGTIYCTVAPQQQQE